MTNSDKKVHSLRQRIGLLLWLRYAVVLTAGFAFVYGSVVLIARAGWQVDRLLLVWGALALAPLVVVAIWLARRQMPRPVVLRAMVDRQSDAGGLIMAGEETELGAWRNAIPQSASPTVRWRGGPGLMALLVGAAFVGVAFGIPDSAASMNQSNQLDVSQQVADLEDKIDTLEEEKIIEEDKATDLIDKLGQIQKDASGVDPSKTFEQLDHIQAQLDKAADDAANEAIKEAGQLTDLENLANELGKALDQTNPETGELEATDESGQPIDPQDLADALNDMGEMIENAMKDSEAFEKLMDKQLAEALKKLGELDPKALEELGKLDEQTVQNLQELAKALEEMEADSLAQVDLAGAVSVYDPDDKLKLAELKKGKKPTDAVAVRLTTEAVFRHDPTVMMTLDLSAFGEGERIIALNEENALAVYKFDENAKVDVTKLGPLDDEYVIIVQPDGTARRYVYSAKESAQCQACQGGDPQKAFRIAGQAAQISKEQLRAMMQRMADQGLITPEQMEACQGACDGNGKPGRGGINRGRGDAAMTWKDPSSKEGSKFDEKTLPPASLQAIKDSELVGASIGAPTKAEGDKSSESGALSGAKASGGAANRQTVLPKHRGSVERYFERE